MIIVKKGRHELLGYGIVTSDYIYDNKRANYHHLRSINWKAKGSWKIDQYSYFTERERPFTCKDPRGYTLCNTDLQEA